MSKITWRNERRRVGDLVAWERNPRQIGVDEAERLVESFDEFGQVEVLAVGPGEQVYNGHQRLNVLMDRYGGDYEVEVRVSSRELTEKEREKLTVYLHKGAAGEWDWDILANEFEVKELLEWGFSEAELQIGGFSVSGEDGDVGDVPEADLDAGEELREKWGVCAGQLWELGVHRLMVGDCTEQGVMDLLFDRQDNAVLWFTDPPYGIEIASKNRELNKVQRSRRNITNIIGDDAIPARDSRLSEDGDVDKWRELLEKSFGLAYDYLSDNCSVFICAPQGGLLRIVMEVLLGVYLEVRHIITWVKNQPTFSLGRLDYDYQHEPILFTWKKTHKRIKAGQFRTSVWEIDKPRASADHPVIKPVELPANAILNHTEPHDIVLDNFLGVGTTMAACQALHRRCFGVELDENYAAIVIERLSNMGCEPKILSTLGESDAIQR